MIHVTTNQTEISLQQAPPWFQQKSSCNLVKNLIHFSVSAFSQHEVHLDAILNDHEDCFPSFADRVRWPLWKIFHLSRPEYFSPSSPLDQNPRIDGLWHDFDRRYIRSVPSEFELQGPYARQRLALSSRRFELPIPRCLNSLVGKILAWSEGVK